MAGLLEIPLPTTQTAHSGIDVFDTCYCHCVLAGVILTSKPSALTQTRKTYNYNEDFCLGNFLFLNDTECNLEPSLFLPRSTLRGVARTETLVSERTCRTVPITKEVKKKPLLDR